MQFAQWKLFSFFSLPVPISVRIHSPYFFLMKVSEREHTSFHHGDIMHPLVEYSLGSDVQFNLFITIVALTAILVVENPGEYTQAFVETMWEKVLLQFFFLSTSLKRCVLNDKVLSNSIWLV